MKKSNIQPLGEVLKNYVKTLKYAGKLNEVKLINKWEDIIGKTIARNTTKIYIKDHILHIYIRSSIIRNELMYIKTALLGKVNEVLENEHVREIVLH